MKKLFNILRGWGKYLGVIPKSRAEEKLSELRLNQCKVCEFSNTSKVLEILNGHANYINTIYCAKCTCPVIQKSLVIEEKCPERKW